MAQPKQRLTSPEHEQLLAEYAEHQAAAAPHLGRMDEIKKILRADLELGTYDIAGLTVTVARSSRIDAAKVAARYPVLANPHLYRPEVDTTALREYLAPAELRELSKQGEPRLTIK